MLEGSHMNYVTTILVAVIGSGVLNTLLNYVLASREKKKERTSGVNKASRLLMKTQLRQLCVHYIQQGWIYDDELEDLIAMHECYHDDLNGNGFLNELMEKVKALEVRGIGVK